MKKIVIRFNAPVILTFALLSLLALLLGNWTGGTATTQFFSVYRSSLADPLTYVRFFGHVLGHTGYEHYMGNMLLLLLVGPGLEEKYGSGTMVWMIALTALVTGLVHFIFFPHSALLGADRVLKYLSRTGKLRLESKYLRLTHLENRGFFLGLGQKHEKLLRWLPMGVWLLAAVCLLPELSKRVFSAQLGILLVLLGGLSNQFDRLRRGSVTDYLQFPHRRVKKRALVWNLADFMLIGGVVLTVLGLLRELVKK